MTSNIGSINAVPTNIITGFLGVGKTTAILHLLKSKPNTERWAVLVNEFGEIGVDGSVFQGQHSEEGGVFIREVPGGCMCCTAGLPMQIALNQLLTRSRPHRLLIEPTGLGHPREILEVLSAHYYQDVLEIQKNVTLIDARKLRDARYVDNDTFNQQIEIADIIIGNKTELYEEGDRDNLKHYVTGIRKKVLPVIFVSQGKFDVDLLEGSSQVIPQIQAQGSEYQVENTSMIEEKPLPENGILKIENKGEGYKSIGWRFATDKIFNRNALFALLSGVSAERIKGVFITEDGVFAYNSTADSLKEFELDDCLESRIEIIYHNQNTLSEKALLKCLVVPA